jgi:hypothetical protein
MPPNLSQQLLDEALRLPDEQRAALAAVLIASLDESVDEDAEAVWATEIAQRLRDVQCGAATTIPWSRARQMIVSYERPDARLPTKRAIRGVERAGGERNERAEKP